MQNIHHVALYSPSLYPAHIYMHTRILLPYLYISIAMLVYDAVVRVSPALTMLSDDTPREGNGSPANLRERRRRREMRQPAVTATAGSSEGKRVRTEATGKHVEPWLSSSSSRDDADVAEVTVPAVGTMSVSGRSRKMEDAICVKTEFCRPVICQKRPVHFFGVYDGHGGANVATLCRDRMHVLLEEELGSVVLNPDDESGISSTSTTSMEVPKLAEAEEERWWRTTLTKCFQRMDDIALNTCGCGVFGLQCGCHPKESALTGSTAVVAVVSADHILVANCGDSRAVLCRGGRPVLLSFDHKPDTPDERARIEASGGRVIYLNGARVDGILAMSRAIGDKYLKPTVTSEPEITFTRRHPEDECLILASDGLWDVMSNELVCEVAHECLREGPLTAVGGERERREREEDATSGALYLSRSASAAALLTRLALRRGSSDNISVIVVNLKRS